MIMIVIMMIINAEENHGDRQEKTQTHMNICICIYICKDMRVYLSVIMIFICVHMYTYIKYRLIILARTHMTRWYDVYLAITRLYCVWFVRLSSPATTSPLALQARGGGEYDISPLSDDLIGLSLEHWQPDIKNKVGISSTIQLLPYLHHKQTILG